MKSLSETNDESSSKGLHGSEASARAICATLRDHGYQAVFAGGCVRDRVMGIDASDYDVATNATPDDIQRVFQKTVPVGVQFGVILVLSDDGPVEVATFRTDGSYSDGRHPDRVEFTTIDQDALRRDYTINGMYLDPEDDAVIDRVGGIADIEARIVRCIGEASDRFQEDALRMLRAVRFAARFKFTIDSATLDAIKTHSALIMNTSAERICAELDKMLTDGNSVTAIKLLDETGLLDHVLPEVSAMHGVEQPPEFHPEGDVFIHTMLLLEGLDRLDDRPASLAWGALLHDIGKPGTQTFEDRIRFNLHDKVGADMTRDICKRLRMPNDRAARIEWLVRYHMRPAITPDMRENKRKRFVREDGFDELLRLCELDAQASHDDSGFVDWLRDYKANLAPEVLRPPPIIRGADLIALGYTPGPLFKEMIDAVEDRQLEGEIATPEEAVAFINETWPLV